jgi:hypothetical protein
MATIPSFLKVSPERRRADARFPLPWPVHDPDLADFSDRIMQQNRHLEQIRDSSERLCSN